MLCIPTEGTAILVCSLGWLFSSMEMRDLRGEGGKWSYEPWLEDRYLGQSQQGQRSGGEKDLDTVHQGSETSTAGQRRRNCQSETVPSIPSSLAYWPVSE